MVGRAEYESGGSAASYQLEMWSVTMNGEAGFARSASQKLASPASYLWHKEGLLAVQSSDNEVNLFDARATFVPLVKNKPAGCYWWFDLSGAEGDIARGLWLPLGAYGVGRIPLP